MNSRQLLKAIHGILLLFQSNLYPANPSESIARVVIAVERELQGTDNFGCAGDWPQCPLWSRIRALESQVGKLKGEMA